MPERDGKSFEDGTAKALRRKDGRRSLLVYMRPDLIKALKTVALERDVTVFSIVEEAAETWLKEHERRRE